MRSLAGKNLIIYLMCGLFSCSCSSISQRKLSQLSLPVAIPAAYFTTIGVHEGGHAFIGELYNAKSIRVRVLPTRENGVNYLGLTKVKWRDNPSSIENSYFNCAGPVANFTQSVIFRGALRTKTIPKLLQPYFAWVDLFGRTSCYAHAIQGIFKIKTSDLGKEDDWVAWSFLGINIAYDIINIFIFDEPERYFGSLFGVEHY